MQRNVPEITGLLLNITVTSQNTVTVVIAGGISFIHLQLFDYLSGSSVGVEKCYDKLDKKWKEADLYGTIPCQVCLRSEE